MYDSYMDNFFKKINKSYVTKYTDSTDFEYPTKIPNVTSKYGKHCLLNYKDIERKDNSDIEMIYRDPKLKLFDTERDNTDIRFQNKANNYNSKEKLTGYRSRKQNNDRNNKSLLGDFSKSRGDQNVLKNYEATSSQSLLRIFPRLSNIFKRCNNQPKQMPSIDENHQIVYANDKKICDGCERRHSQKRRKTHRRFDQPVYAVEGNLEIPFKQKNQDISIQHKYITRNQSSCTPTSLTSSLGSERDSFNHQTNINNKKDQANNYDIFCSTNNYVDCSDYMQHKNLQYPSKYMKTGTQPLINSCCQANYGSIHSNESIIAPTTSSSFWNYVADKIKAKNKKKPSGNCDCEPPKSWCNPSSCEKLNSIREEKSNVNFGALPSSSNRDGISANRFPFQNTKPGQSMKLSNQSPTPSPPSKNQAPRDCQCSKKKMETQETFSRDTDETCQRPHDEITQSLADKYNGQILCIHNPPCILINGCLNLPPPKASGLPNIWHVTQSKKSSDSRNHKLSNQIIEQACQYEPPYVLQECLPEFQTEKIIQSICNHKPPCEVVHGCYKPRFDPKLKDSCVHVPMCQKLPECLIKTDSADGQTQCSHSPKCEELPLCSNKLLVLTAKEDMSTQVKPRPRMVCRHEPPCLMIPKCIGRVICSGMVPYDAIPDCVHQPCCELIPACCRKATKEMPSLTSYDEGVSIKVPRMPVYQRTRLMRLINSKR